MPGERPTTDAGAGNAMDSQRGTSNAGLTVEALLRATAAGDTDAFERLYQATSAKLYGIVLRIVKRPDAADDVLQETYVRIWKHAHAQSGPPGSALGWMIRIARNRALDWLRGRRDEQEYDELKHEATELDERADVEALAAGGEEAKALQRCLQKLEEIQRRCIVLAFLDGYTHQELADRLQAPLGSIKSWIRRGQIRLKECLDS